MSLRKSPQLTPALLAAARSNAQHSTGPRGRQPLLNQQRRSLHGLTPEPVVGFGR